MNHIVCLYGNTLYFRSELHMKFLLLIKYSIPLQQQVMEFPIFKLVLYNILSSVFLLMGKAIKI